MRLNTRQADVLDIVISHKEQTNGSDLNTDEIKSRLPKRGHSSTTYDATHSLLARMEKRKLVKRTGKKFSHVRNGMVATWAFTDEGRKAWTEKDT